MSWWRSGEVLREGVSSRARVDPCRSSRSMICRRAGPGLGRSLTGVSTSSRDRCRPSRLTLDRGLTELLNRSLTGAWPVFYRISREIRSAISHLLIRYSLINYIHSSTMSASSSVIHSLTTIFIHQLCLRGASGIRSSPMNNIHPLTLSPVTSTPPAIFWLGAPADAATRYSPINYINSLFTH
jgi:hypothetical protein